MATNDSDKNKAAGILAYIIFFLPLIMAPKSKFAKYHANQGLLLLILALAVNIVGWIIPVVGPLLIQPIGTLAIMILWIIGVLNAVNGRMKPLPFIGQYEIIK